MKKLPQYESIDEFIKDTSNPLVNPRAIVVHYGMNTARRNNNFIIDAATIGTSKTIQPTTIAAAGQPYTVIKKDGSRFTPHTRYVVSANGVLVLADRVAILPVAALDVEEGKYFGIIEPSGKLKSVREQPSNIRELQSSDHLLTFLREHNGYVR